MHYFAKQRGRNGFCKNPTAKQFSESFKYLLICDLLASPTGANCETGEILTDLTDLTDLLIKNSFKLRKLLDLGRIGVTPPSIPTATNFGQ